MQYEVGSPEEYLSALTEDWRKKTLLEVRQLIQAYEGMTEVIEYKMLNYALNGRSAFHLNAQKNYVSLYVGTIDKVPDAERLLEGLDRGKGCIRIKKSVNVANTHLGEFIANVVDLYQKGQEADC